jgi:hypothetical protein
MRESAAVNGTLSCAAGRLPFTGMPQTQRAWQREILFNGATANALRLGTALTQGWFWMRRNGCTAVHRGSRLSRVDLSRILYVAEPKAGEISLPTCLSHPPGSTHCYLVRRYDGCGRPEKTTSAATMLRIPADGRSALLRPNAVFGLTGRQTGPVRVRWIWFYCPLDQEATPEQFNLYRADGTFVSTVRYGGRRFYSLEGADLADVVVRPVSGAGVEAHPTTSMIHPIATAAPEPAAILIAEPM